MLRVENEDRVLSLAFNKCRIILLTPKNKPTVQKLVSSVLHDISLLADNSKMGTTLNSRLAVNSGLRFLLISTQLVFYQMIDYDLISIIQAINEQIQKLTKAARQRRRPA